FYNSLLLCWKDEGIRNCLFSRPGRVRIFEESGYSIIEGLRVLPEKICALCPERGNDGLRELLANTCSFIRERAQPKTIKGITGLQSRVLSGWCVTGRWHLKACDRFEMFPRGHLKFLKRVG